MKISSFLISVVLIFTVMTTSGWSQTDSYRSTSRVLLLAQATIPNPMTVETIRASVQGTDTPADFLKPEQIVNPPRDEAGNIIPENNGLITLPDGNKIQVKSSHRDETENQQNIRPLPTLPQGNQKTENAKNNLEEQKKDQVSSNGSAPNPYRRSFNTRHNHCRSAEYYPGFFNNNPNARNSFRAAPPISAYGKNLYGQPCSYGSLSARLGFCY